MPNHLIRSTPSMSISMRPRTGLHDPMPALVDFQRVHGHHSQPATRNTPHVNQQQARFFKSAKFRPFIAPFLPPEIISNCLNGLDKRDLYATSLVDKTWSYTSRELLYTEVYLQSSAPNVQRTVSLLLSKEAKDARLPCKIKKAVLDTCTSMMEWIPADFTADWRALTVLELNGMPFGQPYRMMEFSNCVNNSCLNLTTLVVRPFDSFPMLPYLQISVPRLTQIVLQYSLGTSSMDILPLLTASQSRLTHLHFVGRMNYCTAFPFCNMLTNLNMMFPYLISFQLCALHCDTSQYPNQPLAQFLYRHTHLQHFSIGSSIANSMPQRMPPTAHNAPTNGSFPKLESLAVYFDLLEPSKRKIEPLIRGLEEINAGAQAPFSPFGSPSFSFSGGFGIPIRGSHLGFVEIAVDSPFRDVQYLKLEFDEDLSHRRRMNSCPMDAMKAIIRMKELCPNVSVLELKLLCDLDCLAERVLSMPSLQQLECLILHQLCVNSPREDQILSEAQRITLMAKIASSCPQLRYVVMRKPAYSELPDCVFTLNRASDLVVPTWPMNSFSQRLLSVDQQYTTNALECLKQFGISGMEYVESV
ncbi:hypothetical protein BJ165DRAFT_126761 [Panaeolus papilionaceus]|nr:hypothetical protein BJ165DRAFT_126761 [Panaeolus papilionaceus]